MSFPKLSGPRHWQQGALSAQAPKSSRCVAASTPLMNKVVTANDYLHNCWDAHDSSLASIRHGFCANRISALLRSSNCDRETDYNKWAWALTIACASTRRQMGQNRPRTAQEWRLVPLVVLCQACLGRGAPITYYSHAAGELCIV